MALVLGTRWRAWVEGADVASVEELGEGFGRHGSESIEVCLAHGRLRTSKARVDLHTEPPAIVLLDIDDLIVV